MNTAPTREHGFRGFSTLHSYDLLISFCSFAMLIFASFWDRFGKQFWLVLGSTLGALGDQKVSKMSSKIDAKISIEKMGFRERPGTK